MSGTSRPSNAPLLKKDFLEARIIRPTKVALSFFIISLTLTTESVLSDEGKLKMCEI